MTAPRLISRRIGAALVALSLLAAACGDDDDGGAGLTTDDGVIDNTDTSGGAATTPPLPDATPTPPESSTQPTVPPSPTASVAPEPTSEPVGGSLLEGGPVPALRLVPVGEVATPVAMANRAGSASLWIAEKRGVVRRLDETGADPVPVLDLSTRVSGGNEQGLLGLTFSPDGSRLYVDFTDTTGATNVVEYTMSGDIAGTETERTLLVVDQPAANHNAGALAFGPDGYLYVTLGDGGGGGDPFATGQDPGTLLGSILRLDPLADVAPYGIPPDNPFIDGGGRPEVFLYGVRNPWRISFDRSTGDLWIADVGQGDIEEIDVAYAADGGGLGA
ncbi:MAG: PQQ-dependent sugar dehydrogenase, partial [Acidimicrobiales bacterium]|nr:PQQ-dependent sugar dehydrogenase [Acidimicrobiales bacterium]